MIIVNLAEVDGKGHSGYWNNYLDAIQRADSIVYELWNIIQTDTIYKNKTAMIITNDHGRHTTNFSNHGDNCEGCKHIMLMLLGPDTPAGTIDNTAYELIDIAPTVGKYLGFETPLSQGKIINSAIVSVISIKPGLPANYQLMQNYPNPFNHSTTIEFSIPQSAFVSLKIFDVIGREVSTLVLEELEVGKHSRQWNATNIPGGVYFYRFEAGDYSNTKKLILLK